MPLFPIAFTIEQIFCCCFEIAEDEAILLEACRTSEAVEAELRNAAVANITRPPDGHAQSVSAGRAKTERIMKDRVEDLNLAAPKSV